MDPKIWGRNMWTSMVHIAQVYPTNPTNNDINNYKIYYTSIANVLPCEICRGNYRNHLTNLPIRLESKQALLDWLYRIHNQTLIQQNRPQISYLEFMNKYSGKVGYTNSNKTQKVLIVLIILAIIASGSYYYVYKKGNSRPYLRR